MLGMDKLKIKRELDVTNGYKVHKKLGDELYGSINGILERNLFGKCDQYVLRKWGFSYKFLNVAEKGLKHDCFWINPKYKDWWDEERIKKQIKGENKYKRVRILEIWENKQWLRSIKTIRHFHIIYIPNL